MIRISDFPSLVKTFFKNIFSFRLPFEQQFKLFVSKAFETLFRVYVKRVDDAFFHSNERKDKFKSKGFVKRTSSLEKVIEMECLPEIVSETGKSTNLPYLRGGECPIREVLKEISQSKIF
ncbi:hypothetical protein JMUB3935_2021 [Leptotrichia trevisanii]|uniref:Uncharacterized protein n=1 Tax=Leptotrichia trevisanii TaxID=109328 RepID=A0A510KQT8_9FUSO|nr:hypothetical protein JMUB3935_2021 [Leptotrichia trevisanii]